MIYTLFNFSLFEFEFSFKQYKSFHLQRRYKPVTDFMKDPNQLVYSNHVPHIRC